MITIIYISYSLSYVGYVLGFVSFVTYIQLHLASFLSNISQHPMQQQKPPHVSLIVSLSYTSPPVRKNYIPVVMLPLNPTSPPSTAATFLATCLMVVLQPSVYFVFHDGVNPVSVSTLKLPLGVIEVVTLKPRASPILPLCI